MPFRQLLLPFHYSLNECNVFPVLFSSTLLLIFNVLVHFHLLRFQLRPFHSTATATISLYYFTLPSTATATVCRATRLIVHDVLLSTVQPTCTLL